MEEKKYKNGGHLEGAFTSLLMLKFLRNKIPASFLTTLEIIASLSAWRQCW